MEDVPYDRFLQDLADRNVYPDPSDIQDHDVRSIWDEIPEATRMAYLQDLGLPVDEGLEPRLDGSAIVFEPSDGPQPGEELGLSDLFPQDDLGPDEPVLAAARLLDEIDPDALAPPHEAGPNEPVFAAARLLDETDPQDLEPAPSQAPAQEPGHEAGQTGAPEGPQLIDAETISLGEEHALPEQMPDIEAAEAVPVEPAEEDPLEDIEELSEDALEEIDPEDEGPREVEVYPVYEPYAYVRISYDEDDHQYLYEVIEPELSDREEKVLDFIQETIIDVIDVGLSRLTEEEAEDLLVELTNDVIEDYSIDVDDNTRLRLTYYVVRDFLGFGKLDTIMRDPMIEDVNCDGVGVPIFLYHRKYESMASTVVFEEHDELDSFVIKLAQRSGQHISIADPLLDARLPDGSRLNATLSDEVTTKGSTFTIRKFRDEPFTPPDLIRFGTMSEEMLAYQWMSIQHGASMIVAGGTASGKTTLLNAVMLFIPPQMKIVSIEDTRELNLPHPNWIPGTTRSGFGPRDDKGRQAGEINMFQLLKAALRQRPEYITVGEVRGEEASVLFQAMATGHAAYGTMHADSVTSVIHRLEGEPINIPRPLLEALDIVCIQIQTRIGGKRVRRTKEIVEIVGMDPNTKELLTNEVFRWDPADDTFDASGISYVLERIQKEENLSRPELEEEIENRTQIIQWMKENEVRDYVDVAKVVQAYYNEPDKLMETIRIDLGLQEGDASASDILTEVLDDDGGQEDPEESFDPTAEIPIPEDASKVSPLGEDQLDQLGTADDEADPVELAEHGDEAPGEIEAAPVEDLSVDEQPYEGDGPEDPLEGAEPLGDADPETDPLESDLEGLDAHEPLEEGQAPTEDAHDDIHDEVPDRFQDPDVEHLLDEGPFPRDDADPAARDPHEGDGDPLTDILGTQDAEDPLQGAPEPLEDPASDEPMREADGSTHPEPPLDESLLPRDDADPEHAPLQDEDEAPSLDAGADILGIDDAEDPLQETPEPLDDLDPHHPRSPDRDPELERILEDAPDPQDEQEPGPRDPTDAPLEDEDAQEEPQEAPPEDDEEDEETRP